MGCGSALGLLQQLGRFRFEKTPALWLATCGAQAVTAEQTELAVAQAALWGLGRVAAMELPEFACRLIDFDPADNAAAMAVQDGLKNIDDQVQKLRTKRVKVGKGKAAKTEVKVLPGPQAQVALVALDPHTGEVLALANYPSYHPAQRGNLNIAAVDRPAVKQHATRNPPVGIEVQHSVQTAQKSRLPGPCRTGPAGPTLSGKQAAGLKPEMLMLPRVSRQANTGAPLRVTRAPIHRVPQGIKSA